jgi:ADP-heptose:LPS heptosyltransferase
VMLAWESEQRSETLLHQEMLRGVDPNYVPQSVPWRWSLPLPATAYAIAKQWLRDNGLWNEQTNSAKAFALIHAGASKMQNYKKIPAPKFAEAIKWLMKRGFAVVVIGTPDERESLTELQAFVGAPLHGCFHLDLLSVCALIQLSAVLLSNDSGLGHLGILLDTPTVRIFGPENGSRARLRTSFSRLPVRPVYA